MATVSDHSAPSAEVEKEEVKKIDTECASEPPNESVDSTKPDESAAPCAEAEAKIEEKQIEPHVAEHAKDSSADEEAKTVAAAPTEENIDDKAVAVEVPPAGDKSITESTQEKVEDKPVEEDKKIEDVPVVEALDKAITPEPTIEKADISCEEKSEPEPAGKQGEEESIEPRELEEVTKVVDVPESLPAEVIEKIEEKVEEPPAEVVEATEAKDGVAVPEAECKPEETEVKDVMVPEAESKPVATEVKDVAVCEAESKPEEITQPAPFVVQTAEQSEVTEEVKKETPVAEPVEEVEAISRTAKAEDAELPKKEETSPSEAPVIQVEEARVVSHPIDEVCGKTDEGTEKTEPAKESVLVQLEEKAAEAEKIEEKTEVPEEKSVVTEELVRSEEKPTEDSTTSVPLPEPAEKVAKDEATSRDIELVADNGIEKCGTDASPETTEEVKETTKEVEKTEAAEKIEEAAEAKLVEEKQVDEKIKETVEATEAKLEEEKKQVHEPAETDVQNPESIKGSEDTKTTQDVPKEDVPVKTQKQSIVKIVKQSLVKAKKAIIGKSHNSKTPAPEAKDDGNK